MTNPHPWRDETVLRELFHERGLKVQEVADELGTSAWTVRKWTDRLGVNRQPWTDEDRLQRLYHGQGLSVDEVANEVHASVPTVLKWMDEFGIERRSFGEHQTPEPLKDADWLQKQHHDEGRTTGEMANEVGCSPSAVRSALDRHDIERNNPKELSHRAKRILTNETRLRELYAGRKRTQSEIAKIADCSQQTVSAWLSRHGIEARDPVEMARQRTGEDHPNWSDSNDAYYGPNWEQQRAKALKRDGHKCRECGMAASEHLRKIGLSLDVHHVVPFDTFDDYEKANRIGNLHSLCRGCHVDVGDSAWN